MNTYDDIVARRAELQGSDAKQIMDIRDIEPAHEGRRRDDGGGGALRKRRREAATNAFGPNGKGSG